MRRFSSLILFLLLLSLPAACAAPPDLGPGSSLSLASFAENGVQVEITLEVDAHRAAWLAATYTPLESGWHVYAMDTLPEGAGRPTLLELPPGARLQALGGLSASQAPIPLVDSEDDLWIYPDGPVTLRLPVALPEGSAWVEDQVSVTYMACNGRTCRQPVMGRLVSVRLPGADLLANP
ncbi:MAG: hypothetical protein JXB85_14860 [Anaerolineales bacterium]|nr:hypothetical protein [Anaerolineales bacterium]